MIPNFDSLWMTKTRKHLDQDCIEVICLKANERLRKITQKTEIQMQERIKKTQYAKV